MLQQGNIDEIIEIDFNYKILQYMYIISAFHHYQKAKTKIIDNGVLVVAIKQI